MDHSKSQPKLVLLAPSFFPNTGGVEKHLQHVVTELVRRGWKVTVLVRYHSNIPKKQKAFGATVIRMPRSVRKQMLNAWFWKNKKIFDGIEVIHSHDYFPFEIRKHLPDIRWVHTFHGYEGYPLDPNAVRSRQQVAKAVDFSFCVGEFIEKWYGTPCDQIVYGAVENSKMAAKKPKWSFIFYGRFEADTGFENYVKAFRIINEQKPLAKLLVVGHGSLEQWAKSYAQKKHLNIEFRKPVSNVMPLLMQSKVAFVSGYLAILEAGLAKKPIVAFYGTPIKKDYLECHPMAKSFSIVYSSKGIAETGVRALKPNAKDIQSLYNWSHEQTWENLVDQYEKAYKHQS